MCRYMSVFKASKGSSADRPLAPYSKLNLFRPFCGYSRVKFSDLEPIITHCKLDSLGRNMQAHPNGNIQAEAGSEKEIE